MFIVLFDGACNEDLKSGLIVTPFDLELDTRILGVDFVKSID